MDNKKNWELLCCCQQASKHENKGSFLFNNVMITICLDCHWFSTNTINFHTQKKKNWGKNLTCKSNLPVGKIKIFKEWIKPVTLIVQKLYLN